MHGVSIIPTLPPPLLPGIFVQEGIELQLLRGDAHPAQERRTMPRDHNVSTVLEKPCMRSDDVDPSPAPTPSVDSAKELGPQTKIIPHEARWRVLSTCSSVSVTEY